MTFPQRLMHRAAEAAGGARRAELQRELQGRRPAFATINQIDQIGGGGVDAEQRFGFSLGEGEIGGGEFGEQTPCAQCRKRDARARPASQDDLRIGGQRSQQPIERLVERRAVGAVAIVQDQRHAIAAPGERLNQDRASRLIVGLVGDAQRFRPRPSVGFAGHRQSAGEIGEEAGAKPVGRIYRQPRAVDALRAPLPHRLAEQGRLAEAGGRLQQDDLPLKAAAQLIQQPAAFDHARHGVRRPGPRLDGRCMFAFQGRPRHRVGPLSKRAHCFRYGHNSVIAGVQRCEMKKIPPWHRPVPRHTPWRSTRGRSTVIRIGIDVGGTNTDAVVMEGDRVVASFKATTSPDVSAGVSAALAGALTQSGVAAKAVDVVALGTTHFTNAVVQRRDLAPTAAIRLGLPATQALPPMVDWPPDLRDAIGNHYYFAHGGHEFDGRAITPLDPAELRKIAKDIAKKKIRTVAISSVFSPVNSDVEREAGEIIAGAIPGAHITLSSDIGRIGLLERENAAIMNACLRDLSRVVMGAFRQALDHTGISGRFFLTQNDGTLMDAAFAERFPVLTFASGPTNSMRGAAFLSGVQDGIVIDVGGTTTDVGSLHKGFPRQASVAVEIGGVRTNFRMPDVFSIGLGGGSLVVEDEESGKLTVGPRSVGYRLTSEALIFGGKTLTASDVTVAAGLADFGDKSKVAHLPRALIAKARARIMEMAHNAVERSRLSSEPLPVIVVGGGSVLIDSKVGDLDVMKPNHFACANAVGAAIAQVSGEVDRIYMLGKSSRDEALADAKQKATDAAVAAGARADSVTIVDVEDVPLAYIPGNATRVRVKAVGELAL